MASEADVAFTDVLNEDPLSLSSEQIKNYNQLGFISPLEGFAAKDAAMNREYFDSLLAQIPNESSYAINCYQARLAGLWDICTNSRILDHVQDLIGENIVCWASHFFCKLPGDPKKVPWHQDASFWHLSPTKTVTVWLAIDDADESNSAMRFIPRTHRNGSLDTQSVSSDTVLALETKGISDDVTSFSNNLRAGQFSMHADMLVHGSLPNNSTRRRCGLTIRYCPAEVRITNPAWAAGVESIICRGSDKSNTWRHFERPTDDVLVLNKVPVNVGGN